MGAFVRVRNSLLAAQVRARRSGGHGQKSYASIPNLARALDRAKDEAPYILISFDILRRSKFVR